MAAAYPNYAQRISEWAMTPGIQPAWWLLGSSESATVITGHLRELSRIAHAS